MTSFAATITAPRNGRVRTDGMITHRSSLDQYGDALAALQRRDVVLKGRHRHHPLTPLGPGPQQ